MSDFDKMLDSRAAEAEDIIKSFLPAEEGYQKKVIEAMNYSVMAGGKRIRPVLMLEMFKIFSGKDKDLVAPFAAAIEMIHTYSLVHDDLPAMDNDEYRRGRKTTHVVYGAGMATLAGDGLLNYAYETALKVFLCKTNPDPFDGDISDRRAKALEILARKAGIYGMVGGQCADIEAEGKAAATSEELIFIHENKTAAMLESSMMIGALLAGADKKTLDDIEQAARKIGVAFQIQDDVLDVTGDEAELGKPIGSDEKNEKTTYVTLHGLEESKEEVRKLSDEAASIFSKYDGSEEFLIPLVKWMISRQK
ncbi:geranylgeranyl diphosphate synthase, type II [Butyrivibrio sp. ob235]|uniref:polyprenyl synthetase family protein n=1 Tax=Butyrivibrio sp. ob235 TaxID=1761780 RepID=UPI0008D83545|nr:farnesyl diphosphate synthase [Butyrivibrio sp. ob235]SEL42153.1 geranylgeranyl diphosphate synthase, type II [Butyrivibrio sp. ob235]